MLPKEEPKHTPLSLATEASEETYLVSEYSIHYLVTENDNKIEQWPRTFTLTIRNEREVYVKNHWPNRTETMDTLQIVFHNDDDTLRNIRALKLTVDAMLEAAEAAESNRAQNTDEAPRAFPDGLANFFSTVGGKQEENA